MNLTHSLNILIKGQDLSGPALAASVKGVTSLTDSITKADDALKNFGSKGGTGLKLVAGLLKGVIGLILKVTAGLIGLAAGFFTTGLAATGYAQELEYVRQAFVAITNKAAPAMLNALQENSRFMLNDLKLQELYNKAYMLTGETLANRMPEAYASLSKIALSTGDDVDFLMDRLYLSVGRLSTRWMAYLGTAVTVEEAQARASEMFNKTTEALSREEIQAGMLDRVLTKLALKTQDLPEILGSTEQMAAALSASFRNLWGELGTHFLPISRTITSIMLKLVAILDMAISRGGPLYDFFRTFAAMFSVVGDAINKFLVQFMQVDNVVFKGLANLLSKVKSTAWSMFSWGVSIVTQLAAGMIRGAANALTAAINFISSMLSYWFSPGSPPNVAPDIDKWGAAAMEEFLKGFTMASYDILGGVQDKLESVLSALVGADILSKQSAAMMFLEISADMIEALDTLQRSGQVTSQMFQKLAEVGGGFGKHLIKLTEIQIGYSKAVERSELAIRMLEKAEQELDDSQKHLTQTTDDYYMLLLTGASYAELVAGRAQKQAAERRNDAAKAGLTAAEAEKKAAAEAVDGMKERLDLQNLLIDQLTLLLQKQNELAEDAASGGGGGGGGPAGGGGFELPELESPLSGVGMAIDQEFENLKASILLKFKGLWKNIVADWNASGAGQAIAGLQTSLGKLNTWVGLHAPGIAEGIAKIAQPIYDWIADDIVGDSLEEWGRWGDWWVKESPGIGEATATLFKVVMENEWISQELKELNDFLADLGIIVLTLTKIYRLVANLFGILLRGSIDLLVDYILGRERAFDEEVTTITQSVLTTIAEFSPALAEIVADIAGVDLTTTMKNLEDAITDSKLGEIVVGVGDEISTTLDTKLKQPMQEVNSLWGTNLGEMTGAVSGHYSKVLPMYTQDSIWLGITLPVAGETWRSASVDTIWPGVSGAVSTAWSSIEGWFGNMQTWMTTTLVTALGELKTAFDDKMGSAASVTDIAKSSVQKLKDKVVELWNWLQGKEFKVKFKVEKPADLEDNSPLKIHTKIMEMDTWLKNSNMQVKLTLPELLGGAGSTLASALQYQAPGTGDTRIYIENLILEGVQDKRGLLRELQEAV